MRKNDFYHQPKSVDAYSLDSEHFHIRLKTTKGLVQTVTLLWGDGFEFRFVNGLHLWQKHEISMIKVAESSDFDYWGVVISPKYKRIKYAFIINDTHLLGNRDLFDWHEFPVITYENQELLYRFFNFPWMNESDILSVPDWVRKTIWYQIFPDSFRKHNQDFELFDKFHERPIDRPVFYGGDLKGIIEKLPYLHDLGINGLYFTPIFKSRSQHKYDIVDYYEIDPAFGTKSDFKRLVDEAHKLGIKVMLDAVFNHTSYYHPFFLDIVKNGKNSPYYGYYKFFQDPPINFDVDEELSPVNGRKIFERIHTEGPFLSYHSFAFGYGMPKTNFDHPKMREYLLNVGKYWIKEFNIDGWRLDVANEVSHDFWREFRKNCKEIKSDVFILCENWYDSEPWLKGDQFDGAMNFDLMFSVWSFFSKKAFVHYSSQDLTDRILDYISRYPQQVLPAMFNMLDCHDTERLFSLVNHNADLFKQAFAFLFSLPGAPVIYYGDEIGIPGDGPRGNREPMVWNKNVQNQDFFLFFKRLIALRKTNPILSDIPFNFISTDDESVLIFKKSDHYFIFNNQDKSITITLDDFVEKDVFNDIIFSSPTKKIDVPSYGFYILK